MVNENEIYSFEIDFLFQCVSHTLIKRYICHSKKYNSFLQQLLKIINDQLRNLCLFLHVVSNISVSNKYSSAEVVRSSRTVLRFIAISLKISRLLELVLGFDVVISAGSGTFSSADTF